MKRFLLLGFSLILIFALLGCGEPYETPEISDINSESNNVEQGEIMASGVHVSEVIDELVFFSLEEFLDAYNAVRAGISTEDIARLESGANLATLETIYFPIGIPEEYQLYRITVNVETVGFWYLREDDLVSEYSIQMALAYQHHYLFFFTRWDMESPMEGVFSQRNATEADLIDGVYLFTPPNKYVWFSDREILTLYTPIPFSVDQQKAMLTDEFDDILWQELKQELSDDAKQQQYTEVMVVNLLDENEVSALLSFVESAMEENIENDLEFSEEADDVDITEDTNDVELGDEDSDED